MIIKTQLAHQRSFKTSWMPEAIVWSDEQTADVPEEIAERLINDVDEIEAAPGAEEGEAAAYVETIDAREGDPDDRVEPVDEGEAERPEPSTEMNEDD